MSYFFPSQNRIEDIREKQEEEAEATVRAQFAMEQILYCRDSVYLQDLNTLKERTAKGTCQTAATKALTINGFQPAKENALFTEMACHLKAYFSVSSDFLSPCKSSIWGHCMCTFFSR